MRFDQAVLYLVVWWSYESELDFYATLRIKEEHPP